MKKYVVFGQLLAASNLRMRKYRYKHIYLEYSLSLHYHVHCMQSCALLVFVPHPTPSICMTHLLPQVMALWFTFLASSRRLRKMYGRVKVCSSIHKTQTQSSHACFCMCLRALNEILLCAIPGLEGWEKRLVISDRAHIGMCSFCLSGPSIIRNDLFSIHQM